MENVRTSARPSRTPSRPDQPDRADSAVADATARDPPNGQRLAHRHRARLGRRPRAGSVWLWDDGLQRLLAVEIARLRQRRIDRLLAVTQSPATRLGRSFPPTARNPAVAPPWPCA